MAAAAPLSFWQLQWLSHSRQFSNCCKLWLKNGDIKMKSFEVEKYKCKKQGCTCEWILTYTDGKYEEWKLLKFDGIWCPVHDHQVVRNFQTTEKGHENENL